MNEHRGETGKLNKKGDGKVGVNKQGDEKRWSG